jgi:hypothetical protein
VAAELSSWEEGASVSGRVPVKVDSKRRDTKMLLALVQVRPTESTLYERRTTVPRLVHPYETPLMISQAIMHSATHAPLIGVPGPFMYPK